MIRFNTERSLPSEERLRSLIHGGVGEVAAATPTRREGAAGTTEGAAGEAPEGGGGGGGTSLAGLVTGLVSAVGHRLVEASNMEEVEASGGLADWEAEDDKTKYEELHAREQVSAAARE